MIYWIISLVTAIIVIAVLSVLINKKKKEIKNLAEEISGFKVKVGNLERDKESQERISEILKEIVFFSQLGYEPTEDEKRKMMDQLLDSVKYISDMRSENSWFQTEHALREASKVQRTGRELSEVIQSLWSVLSGSVINNTSLYPQMSDFVHYCGFKFCGKKGNPKSRIKEWGEVVNFGHVEE